MKLFGYRLIKDVEYQDLKDKLSDSEIEIKNNIFHHTVRLDCSKGLDKYLITPEIILSINGVEHKYKLKVKK